MDPFGIGLTPDAPPSRSRRGEEEERPLPASLFCLREGVFISAGLLTAIVHYSQYHGRLSDASIVMQWIAMSGSTAAMCVAYGVLARGLAPMPASFPHFAKSIWQKLAVVVLGTLTIIIVPALIEPFYHEPVEEPLLQELAMAESSARVASICTLDPAMEEFLFRFMMFRRLLLSAGPVPAYAASSLLFGLVHASDTSNKVATAAFSGLILGMVYHATGSVAASLAVHAFNNTLFTGYFSALSPLTPGGEARRVAWLRAAAQLDLAFTAAQYRCLQLLGTLGLQPDAFGGFFDRNGGLTDNFRFFANSLFDRLDTEKKGWLDADQYAQFLALLPSERRQLTAAKNVLRAYCRRHPDECGGDADLRRRWREYCDALYPLRLQYAHSLSRATMHPHGAGDDSVAGVDREEFLHLVRVLAQCKPNEFRIVRASGPDRFALEL